MPSPAACAREPSSPSSSAASPPSSSSSLRSRRRLSKQYMPHKQPIDGLAARIDERHAVALVARHQLDLARHALASLDRHGYVEAHREQRAIEAKERPVEAEAVVEVGDGAAFGLAVERLLHAHSLLAL